MAIAASGMLAPDVALSTTSNFSDFANGRQLSDAELGQLRGRFVDKGRILFFGVQMTSEWRNPAGGHLRAGATLHGDLTGRAPSVSFEPHLTMVSAGNAVVAGPSGNGAIVRDGGTGGIGNARGVVQSIQAAGDFNAAANDLQIDVLDASQHPGVPSGSGASSSQQLPSGTRISASYGPQGMNVALDMPGMGSVTQAIVPSRGLRQSIQLTSDLQQVRNLTRLQLYMGQSGADASPPGLRTAIESVRQLRR
ncbi:hypothetical protein [Halomonas alimentaria]|uniref:Uncharacterized protein n=1 Tax=Halomonas alimentaria TaxID=147248 RepID=A0A7X4W3X4_9GAMM|nr:hypothetical protein [Halomonas alimentaria]NAW33713.1 hypothetical protein [Halomonas alimentaria]